MNCYQSEKFAVYLSRNLSDQEKSEFENHLASCESCFDEFLCFQENIENIRRQPHRVPAAIEKKAEELFGLNSKSFREKIQSFYESFNLPKLATTFAGIGFLLVATYLFVKKDTIAPENHSYSFSPGYTILWEKKITLNPDLKKNILAYKQNPTPTAKENLLNQLQVSEKIELIQINGEVITGIEKSEIAGITLRFYKEGVLEIGG